MSDGQIFRYEDVSARKLVEDSADVVIVGTGAAGATAARVLCEAGLDVICLEEGPLITSDEFRADAYSGFRRGWRDLGFQAAEGRSFLPILQGSCVGGTTLMNGAIIHRLPEEIYRLWNKEHNVSQGFSYDKLQAVFNQLDEELSVGTAGDEILGDNNALMRSGVAALGISGNLIRRNSRECRGSGRCLQGCPTDQKQSMNRSFIPYSVARGARIYAECQAQRIIVKSGQAVGFEGRFRSQADRTWGPKIRVSARRAVVLAASAIQTPLLLASNGVGRQSRLVGRRFQAHPGTSVLGVFDRPVKMWKGATQGYETTHYWHDRMKFEAVGVPLAIGAARLPGFGADLIQRIAEFGHISSWGGQVRCRAHGSVKRGFGGRTVVRYSPTAEDVATFKKGIRILCEMNFAAGAKQVLPGIHGLPEAIDNMDQLKPLDDLPDDPRLFHAIAAHLFGTAVMGNNPRTSVVGLDCQSHELEQLFVVDSSVFPTNLGVNPQHSISAMSWIASERIADAHC